MAYTVPSAQFYSMSERIFLFCPCPPLTSSSQLQPRSWVTVASESDAGDGAVTSSGMLGWYGGSFSISFKLPWVPLFGAGFNPNKSETERDREKTESLLMKQSEMYLNILGNQPGFFYTLTIFTPTI